MGVVDNTVEKVILGTPSSSEESEERDQKAPLRSRLLSEMAEDNKSSTAAGSGSSSDSTTSHHGPQKTLVIYSGPTSMNRLDGKNGMYIDNMNYFLEHGISCFDDDPESTGDTENNADSVIVKYAFVLTQEVANYYTAPNGPLTKKIQECKSTDKKVPENGEDSFIKVLTRLDRCYDMESIRIVVTNMNVQALYDNLLFVNCGLAGPKFGPGSPRLIPSSSSSSKSNPNLTMVPYSHWSQLYTSRLTDSVRLVGHSINTHFHTFFPHVQSFLYALRTDTVPILISSGAIYDCGLTQEELGGNPQKRFELINRYEVGMSTQLLKQGYNIATAFVNRYEFGKSLVYDKSSTWGTELDDTVSDIWYEDGIRNLTVTMSKPAPKFWAAAATTTTNDEPSLREKNNYERAEDTFEYHQWDILPWDYFMFFKVSRLVPEDVQREMNYNIEELEKSDVLVISNDPRRSPSEYWQRKSEVYIEPRNVHLDLILAGVFIMIIGLGLKRRRTRIPVNMMMNGQISPRRRMGFGLSRKLSHDHET